MKREQMLNNPLADEYVGELMMERYAEIARQQALDIPVLSHDQSDELPQDVIRTQVLEDRFRGITMEVESDPDPTSL